MQHLLIAFFILLQLSLKGIGILEKGDHGQAPHHFSVLENRVHVDKIDLILFLHPRGVKDGFSGGEHLGQPGSRAQVPQVLTFNGTDADSRLFAQKIQVGLIAEYNAPLRVNDVNAFPHGIQHSAGILIQFH